MAQKVVIGLSGGVDSSVAAYLLKEQGYEVIALFMVNWHDTTGVLDGDCPAEHDRLLAQLVARKLDIEFHEVDFSEDYSKRVVDYMFAEYEKGRTPNPDVLCNREIKFDPFIKKAEELGADFFATGHYCRKEEIEIESVDSAGEKSTKTMYRLLGGVDNNKDQSYFLCQLNQKQLEKVLFPIGHLEKPEVRRIALEQGLATAERKDSQGICFVGKVDLPTFLQQKLKVKKGSIIEIPTNFNFPTLPDDINNDDPNLEQLLEEYAKDFRFSGVDGKVVGMHDGAHFFTIGQRKGLHVGGKAEPLFVIGTDIEKNSVFVGMGKNHPGLYRKALFINHNEIHWIRPDLEMKPGEWRRYGTRIRYRQPIQEARLFCFEKGIYIFFDKPQRGIAKGQFAAWYEGDEQLGSGVINE